MKIYQISGLGANEKVFENLRLPEGFETVYLPWLIPEKEESLLHYAERLIVPINVNEEFMLMGVSFGGMVMNSINELIQPKFNILISTVKERKELPNYMKFSAFTGLHRIIPASFLTSDSGLSYALFRKIYKARLPNLKEVFEYRDPYYLKWSIDKIVNWNPEHPLKNFVHVHGTKDIIFPSSHIRNSKIIDGGSHVMVVLRPKAVSKLVNEELLKF